MSAAVAIKTLVSAQLKVRNGNALSLENFLKLGDFMIDITGRLKRRSNLCKLMNTGRASHSVPSSLKCLLR